jgi:nucleoside-diphosphate-sugar epimerase
MRILVTGASGFVGRNLLLGLPKDWEIVAIYRSGNDFATFLRNHGLAHVVALQVDLCSPDAVRALPAIHKAFDACVYLAANGDPALSVDNPSKDLLDNTLGLINLIQQTEIGHMVYFSSGAVYDGLMGEVNPDIAVRPLLPYAISKWASERYVFHGEKEGRIKTASVVRFFGAYGPHEPARKIYGKLVKAFAIEHQKEFSIRGNGENLIDAMHVDDTVRAILLILKRSKDSKIIDLYSGRPLKIRDLVRTAAETFGIDPKINLIGTVPEFIEFKSNDTYMADVLKFKPTISLEDGLSSFHRWMLNQPQ